MNFSTTFSAALQKLTTTPTAELTSEQASWLSQLVGRQAQAEGIFPMPTHCDDDGNPLYSIEELAAYFGKTPEEAQQALEKMLAKEPELADCLHPGTAHRIN